MHVCARAYHLQFDITRDVNTYTCARVRYRNRFRDRRIYLSVARSTWSRSSSVIDSARLFSVCKYCFAGRSERDGKTGFVPWVRSGQATISRLPRDLFPSIHINGDRRHEKDDRRPRFANTVFALAKRKKKKIPDRSVVRAATFRRKAVKLR